MNTVVSREVALHTIAVERDKIAPPCAWPTNVSACTAPTGWEWERSVLPMGEGCAEIRLVHRGEGGIAQIITRSDFEEYLRKPLNEPVAVPKSTAMPQPPSAPDNTRESVIAYLTLYTKVWPKNMDSVNKPMFTGWRWEMRVGVPILILERKPIVGITKDEWKARLNKMNKPPEPTRAPEDEASRLFAAVKADTSKVYAFLASKHGFWPSFSSWQRDELIAPHGWQWQGNMSNGEVCLWKQGTEDTKVRQADYLEWLQNGGSVVLGDCIDIEAGAPLPVGPILTPNIGVLMVWDGKQPLTAGHKTADGTVRYVTASHACLEVDGTILIRPVSSIRVLNDNAEIASGLIFPKQHVMEVERRTLAEHLRRLRDAGVIKLVGDT